MTVRGPDSVTRTLAAFAVGARYDDLPEPVRHKTEQVICDTAACMLGGTAVVTGSVASRFVKRLGGVPEATVVGQRDKTSITNAAFANGSLANALDFDETFMNQSHPASLAVVAALALGEAGHVSGREVVTAVAAGYDVAARIAIATESPSTFGVERAPVSSGSWQTYASIAASGRILGLDEQQMVDAFGIGAVMAPMPTQSVAFARTDGYPLIKYLPTGWATQAGIVAAIMAAEGITGPAAVLDGDNGFWRMQAFTSCDFDYMAKALGETWWIAQAALKPWPCCRAIHPYLTALETILTTHDLAAEDIDEVRLIGNLAARPSAGTKLSIGADFSDPEPVGLINQQFSLPYAVANLALKVPCGPQYYDESPARRQAVRDFVRRITIEQDPASIAVLREQVSGDHPRRVRRVQVAVEVRAKGGTYRAETNYSKGDAWGTGTALTDADLMAKLHTSTAGAVLEAPLGGAQVDALGNTLLNLRNCDDVAEAMALLAGDAGPALA
jgi:2-methylcitrate dehydratase PrpD